MPFTIHSRIDSERGAFDSDFKEIPTYRAYALGDQTDVLNEAQTKMLDKCRTFGQADNICHLGLVETADRVRLEGVDVEGAEEDGESVDPRLTGTQTEIDRLYVKNAVADLSSEINYVTARDGNAGLFIDWKRTVLPAAAKPSLMTRALRAVGIGSAPASKFGSVRFKLEPWWDGVSGVYLSDPDADEESFACKEWTEYTEAYNLSSPKQTRRIVWFDNRIEQWVRSDAATGENDWQEFAQTVPWTRTGAFGGAPLHIPFAHFANPGKRKGHCGLSKLSGGILRMQDEINRGQSDLTISMDMSAFPMLKMKGYHPQIVPVGTAGAIEVMDPETRQTYWLRKPTVEMGPGYVFDDPSPNFDVDSIPPGDLSQIQEGITFKYKSAARNLRIPEYVIAGGTVPSGYALERAEQPAIGEAQAMIDRFTPAWATAFHRATEMLATFGKLDLDENALLLPRFADPKRPDKLYTISVERAELALDAEKAAVEAGTYATVLTGEKTDPAGVPGSPTTTLPAAKQPVRRSVERDADGRISAVVEG